MATQCLQTVNSQLFLTNKDVFKAVFEKPEPPTLPEIKDFNGLGDEACLKLFRKRYSVEMRGLPPQSDGPVDTTRHQDDHPPLEK